MGDLNILVATQVRIIAGIIGLIIIFIINKEFYKLKSVFKSKKVMISIFIGSLFGSTFGVVFSLLAIKHTTVGVASTIMALAPILVIPISIKVFDEKVDRKAILGAFIAILGVTMLVFA
ncbi:EamA family transporter [Clostridiaceae bacterium HSG29]|nr:EamA family transporter [Clostridiaceae bacterium HSG29]